MRLFVCLSDQGSKDVQPIKVNTIEGDEVFLVCRLDRVE